MTHLQRDVLTDRRSGHGLIHRGHMDDAAAVARICTAFAPHDGVTDARKNTLRGIQDHGDDGHTKHHAMNAMNFVAQFGVQYFRQGNQHQCAQYRPPQGGDPAKQSHDHGLGRSQHAKNRRWRDHNQHHSVVTAGRRCNGARDHDGLEFPQGRVNPRPFSGCFVLLDGGQGQTKARGVNAAGHIDGYGQEKNAHHNIGVLFLKLHVPRAVLALHGNGNFLVTQPLKHI